MQENKIRDRLAHAYYQREKSCEDDEVAFIEGWNACASHAPAVSVEGEKARKRLRQHLEVLELMVGYQAEENPTATAKCIAETTSVIAKQCLALLSEALGEK